MESLKLPSFCYNLTSQKQHMQCHQQKCFVGKCPSPSFLSHSQYTLWSYKFLCSPVVNETEELIPAATTFTLPLLFIFAKWTLTWVIPSHELFPPNTCMRWANEELSTFHEARKDIPPARLKKVTNDTKFSLFKQRLLQFGCILNFLWA